MTADAEPAKLPCPFCQSTHSVTLETRWSEARQGTRRRRCCQDCQGRFSTLETLMRDEPATRLRPGVIRLSTNT